MVGDQLVNQAKVSFFQILLDEDRQCNSKRQNEYNRQWPPRLTLEHATGILLGENLKLAARLQSIITTGVSHLKPSTSAINLLPNVLNSLNSMTDLEHKEMQQSRLLYPQLTPNK
jgi:hypothetical protein